MTLTYGVAALGRPTFDVPFAEEMMHKAFKALDDAGIKTVGPRELLFDAGAAEKAVADIEAAGTIDALLILQITFTDATMTVKLAGNASVPVAVWAVPEPRIGGRLRLNAFCGLNLAAHALGRADVPYGWLYAHPEKEGLADELRALATPSTSGYTLLEAGEEMDDAAAERVLAALNGSKISVVGKHPDGFDTCEYDEDLLQNMVGMSVDTITTDALFERAKSVDADRVAAAKEQTASLKGIDEVDQEQLDRSLRVFCGLQDVAEDTGAKALGVRCWPEMFTDYGCAACGPMAMMNENKVPSACEADVHGALSQLMLQELSGEPAWMTDLVDITPEDDTAVLWHCGLAPLSMKDPEAEAEATIHTNRRMPLLHQFPIKPGRVTLARLSRAKNETRMMIAGAEVVRAPMAFTGTSGTIKFDRPAGEVCAIVLEEGMEHHFALVYGEHRPALRSIAKKLGVPVSELC